MTPQGKTAQNQRVRRTLMSKLCKEATLTRTQIQSDPAKTPSLCEFLTHVNRETGSSVQGLAFATNGTRTVLGFDKVSSTGAPKLTVAPIDGREFDPTKLFELRLWVPVKLPDEPAEGDVLAHEYRWANGVGAVELTLTSGRPKAPSEGTESAHVGGWFHKGVCPRYQHWSDKTGQTRHRY